MFSTEKNDVVLSRDIYTGFKTVQHIYNLNLYIEKIHIYLVIIIYLEMKQQFKINVSVELVRKSIQQVKY